MKPRCLLSVLIVVLVSATAALADAPTTLGAGIYEWKYTSVGGGSRGDLAITTVYVLKEDGKYQSLYGPVSGRWQYERINATTATLRLASQRLGFLGDFEATTLRFTTPTGGTYSFGTSTPLDAVFNLYPFSTRSRLSNSSIRIFVRQGDRAYMGFVISEPATLVCVRAIGPGLAPFGVLDTLSAPVLTIRRDNAVVQSNAGWGTPDVNPRGVTRSPDGVQRLRGVAAFLGAFPLPERSADSAVQWIATAGSYVAEVSNLDPDDSGEVLLEVYSYP